MPRATPVSTVSQTAFFAEPAGRTDDPNTLKMLEVDYTPEGAAVLGVMGLGLELHHQPHRVLHPSLGSGVWARAISACYQRGPSRCAEGPAIVGVEPRESERHNMIETCPDGVFVMSFEEFLGIRHEPFDLVIDNIPFTGFPRRDKKRKIDTWGWHIELLRAGLLTEDAIVAFYGLTQMGQGEAAQASLREWSPMLALRYGGRNEHRGEGTERLAPIPKKYQVPGGPTHETRENGGDSREYTLWIWSVADLRRRQAQVTTIEGLKAFSSSLNDAYGASDVFDAQICRLKRPRWETVQLPVLPKHLRCWSPDAVPGTRPIPQETVDTVAALLRGGL